jgi:hypothetical protein
MPDNSDDEYNRIEEEFLRESCLTFEFELKAPDDEDGALGHLEQAVFKAKTESIDQLERMKKLVEYFKDLTFEKALRYPICHVLIVKEKGWCIQSSLLFPWIWSNSRPLRQIARQPAFQR